MSRNLRPVDAQLRREAICRKAGHDTRGSAICESDIGSGVQRCIRCGLYVPTRRA